MPDQPVVPLVGSPSDLATFVDEGFGKRIVAATSSLSAIVTAFRPGQEIPAHAPDINIVMSILQGDGHVRIGEETHLVRAGDVIVIPAGEVRAVRGGAGGMTALNVASPPPTPEDHATGRLDLTWPVDGAIGEKLAASISSEHGGLRPRLAALSDLASRLGELEPEARRSHLDEAVRFLRSDLLPHAAAEEKAVYPAADRVLRARGGAVQTMLLEHRTILDLVEQLEQAAVDDSIDDLSRILHVLSAITLLHLDEEEAVYLPALAGLSDSEAEELLHDLHGHHH